MYVIINKLGKSLTLTWHRISFYGLIGYFKHWLHTHNIGIVLMSCVRVYVLLTCFPAIISHNMFRSKIYH